VDGINFPLTIRDYPYTVSPGGMVYRFLCCSPVRSDFPSGAFIFLAAVIETNRKPGICLDITLPR